MNLLFDYPRQRFPFTTQTFPVGSLLVNKSTGQLCFLPSDEEGNISSRLLTTGPVPITTGSAFPSATYAPSSVASQFFYSTGREYGPGLLATNLADKPKEAVPGVIPGAYRNYSGQTLLLGSLSAAEGLDAGRLSESYYAFGSRAGSSGRAIGAFGTYAQSRGSDSLPIDSLLDRSLFVGAYSGLGCDGKDSTSNPSIRKNFNVAIGAYSINRPANPPQDINWRYYCSCSVAVGYNTLAGLYGEDKAGQSWDPQARMIAIGPNNLGNASPTRNQYARYDDLHGDIVSIGPDTLSNVLGPDLFSPGKSNKYGIEKSVVIGPQLGVNRTVTVYHTNILTTTDYPSNQKDFLGIHALRTSGNLLQTGGGIFGNGTSGYESWIGNRWRFRGYYQDYYWYANEDPAQYWYMQTSSYDDRVILWPWSPSEQRVGFGAYVSQGPDQMVTLGDGSSIKGTTVNGTFVMNDKTYRVANGLIYEIK